MAGWPIFKKAGVFVAHPDYNDADKIAQLFAKYKIGWCAMYVQQGGQEQNASWLAAHDWAKACRKNGVVFGIWGYLTTDPVGDAQLASKLIAKYDDAAHSLFYIADAEADYKSDTGGDLTRSQKFVTAFRKLRPGRRAALTSYGAATWDNLLGSVFNYRPWQDNKFDFLPQAYFNQSPELEPRHCVEQAVANGWPVDRVHPIVGIYNDTYGRFNGDQYSYLIRNLASTGFSIFNGENLAEDDLKALARLL